MSLARRHRIPNYHSARGPGGVFVPVTQAAPSMRLIEGIEIYNAYFAAVCEYQELRPNDVLAELALPGERTLDPQWRKACYARQLAIYLAHVNGKVPQRMLAQIVGLSPSGVCRALQAVEDTRDHSAYDTLIETITIEMKAAHAADHP